MDINLSYDPQPKQLILHQTIARQIFYGGAAGGGKSYGMLMDAVVFCLQNPGMDAYLFRRTLGELEDTHIRVVKKLLNEHPELGDYKDNKKRVEWLNNAYLNFCFCEREHDVDRYLSAEMHWLGLDEASKFTPYQITMLRTRVRLGGFKPAEGQSHLLPRVIMASNPGGPSHSFLKRTFIDSAPAMQRFYDEGTKNPYDDKDKGWLSVYIPARMADNKYLDLDYAGVFSGLPDELARAYRDGDWDAVVGAALHTLSRTRHQVRAFKPPKHWTRFQVIDWGTAVPFCVGWFVVSDGATLAAKDNWPERYLPSGAVILYDEWYGWNGRENQGCRLDSVAVGRGIVEREKAREDTMDYRVADSSMWAQTDGPSVIERMGQVDPRLVFKKAEKDRKHNYSEFLARLAGNPVYRETGKEEEHPMFYATANCKHFWRTVPSLTLDEIDPEKGPNTKLEDHPYDVCAYGLRSRPYVTKQEDRWWEDNIEEIKASRKLNVDPYATA